MMTPVGDQGVGTGCVMVKTCSLLKLLHALPSKALTRQLSVSNGKVVEGV